MFTKHRGKMFDWLRRNERDMADCCGISPVAQLEHNRVLGKDFLAVHVNQMASGDADLLSKRKVSVVHCPRSHAYFGHKTFAMRELLTKKINICLGTDSLATVRKPRAQTVELNLFEEMRALAASPIGADLSPQTILEMATINGAKALGLGKAIGRLAPGYFADLIVIPFDGKVSNIYEVVLHHPGPVTASMIDGQWAIAPTLH